MFSSNTNRTINNTTNTLLKGEEKNETQKRNEPYNLQIIIPQSVEFQLCMFEEQQKQ